MPENWTPGPWKVTKGLLSEWNVVAPHAGCADDDGLVAPAEFEAEAHLIAAAPELYEVVKRLVEDGEDTADVAMEGIRALAKARGEE